MQCSQQASLPIHLPNTNNTSSSLRNLVVIDRVTSSPSQRPPSSSSTRSTCPQSTMNHDRLPIPSHPTKRMQALPHTFNRLHHLTLHSAPATPRKSHTLRTKNQYTRVEEKKASIDSTYKMHTTKKPPIPSPLTTSSPLPAPRVGIRSQHCNFKFPFANHEDYIKRIYSCLKCFLSAFMLHLSLSRQSFSQHDTQLVFSCLV